MKMIAIDAGHPSKEGDCGVVVDGLIEKDWNLAAAKALNQSINWMSNKVGALIRDDDGPMGLALRGQMSEKMGADFVISLHVNASSDPRVCGPMAFCLEDDAIGFSVARRFMESYGRSKLGLYVLNGEVHERKNRPTRASEKGTWNRVYNVLSRHKCPSVLIEAGFATNDLDRSFLQSDTGVDEICAALSFAVAMI